MSLLERLKQDHREVLERFSLLATTLQSIETQELKLLSESKDLVAVFNLLKDKIPDHFASEETVLFPWLERLVPTEKTFIQELLSEHKEIRADIAALTIDVKSPDVPLERIKSLLKGIVERLSAHARKEDEKLLPLARRYSSEDQLKELDRLAREMVDT